MRWSSLSATWVGLRINNIIPAGPFAPVRGEVGRPAINRSNVWSYIDARGVGLAYRAAPNVRLDITYS